MTKLPEAADSRCRTMREECLTTDDHSERPKTDD
jgi:hypothetical protein